MKRLLYFAAVIVAIGSIGGHTFTAHAQTAQNLTPSQQAAIEQQLEVAKAQLANLQMQAGMVPAGDEGTATVAPSTTVATPASQPTVAANNGLSAAQVALFNNTLNSLVTMLTQLNASIASNATLTAEQQVAVENTLGGMQNTLVAMAATVNNAAAHNSSNANNGSVSAAAPVATNVTPSQQPLAQNTPSTPAASTPATTPSTPAAPATQSPTVAAQSTDNTQQTAQASSFWSFTKSHWPTIVIVLLVIAILAILFWPEKETVRTVTTTPPVTNKPKASAPGVTVSQTTVTTSPSNNGHTTTHTTTTQSTPATPVASAVAAPAHK